MRVKPVNPHPPPPINWRVIALMILVFGITLRHAWQIPAFEGPDERSHFGYVAELRRHHALPNPSVNTLAAHEAAQPPLQYVVAWMWSYLAPFDEAWDSGLAANDYFTLSPSTLGDNQNRWLFGPNQAPYNRTLELSLHWARMLSVYMGVLAAAIGWRAIRRTVPRDWQLVALTLFAFNPVSVRVFALFGNDAAATLFGVVGVWALVMLITTEPTPRRTVLLGVLVGLGTLTKASLLVFPTIIGAALLIRAPRRVIAFAAPVALIVALWYGRALLLYGDPLGMAPHVASPWAFNPPRPLIDALRAELWTLPTLWQPMWLGTANAPLGVGRWLLIVQLLPLIGGLFALIRRPHALPRPLLVALLLTVAIFGVAYMRWLTQFTQVTARLVLPAYLALVIVSTAAMPLTLRRVRVAIVGTMLWLSVVWIGGTGLPRAYAVTPRPLDALPTLSGGPLRFDSVEWLGYALHTPRIDGTRPLDVTLCWRSLDDAPLTVPTPFGVALVRHGDVLAGRLSLHGMGSHTLWQPHSAFCDRVQLPITGEVERGAGYEITVGLYDPDTGEPLVESDDRRTLVGWIGSSGPALTHTEADTAPYRFDGGVRLLSHTFTDDGEQFTLTTDWGTADWQARPLRLFVHLFDADMNLVSQYDDQLGLMDYPAFVWGRYERTYQQTTALPVSDDLPDGRYCARIGLYEPETRDRVTLTDNENAPLTDFIAELGCITRGS